ncbi:MAG: DUF423 domain-containing protein [Candidatus Latescibacterota bacterium]|nr:DUF423 domain-containing protein [Candidatus Latescibacterota bacterium]
MSNHFFSIGSILALLAVAGGAFGGHVLKPRLSEYHLEIFEIASRYHMYHAIAVIICSWAINKFSSTWAQTAGWFFVIGIMIFSGSLYLLSITELRLLGFVTPVGGTAFMLGWLCLAIAPWRKCIWSKSNT